MRPVHQFDGINSIVYELYLFLFSLPIVPTLGPFRPTPAVAPKAAPMEAPSLPVQKVTAGAATERLIPALVDAPAPFQAAEVRTASPFLGLLAASTPIEVATARSDLLPSFRSFIGRTEKRSVRF